MPSPPRRRSPLLACLLGLASFASCGGTRSAPPPLQWTYGFWFWQGSSAAVTTRQAPLDTLFVQAGTISSRGDGQVWAYLPDALPRAKEYWLVFRYDGRGLPSAAAIPQLVERIADLQATAHRRQWSLAGIQLDIDAPTAKLPAYAHYLRALRQALPPGTQISITALLDWFRQGTDVAPVIEAVDEYVPQFYDLQDTDASTGGTPIAARFEASRWAPLFARFEKRFRIGISVFGRIRIVTKEASAPGVLTVAYDLDPLNLIANPDIQVQSSVTEARELLVRYRVVHPTRVGYRDFVAGDAIDFVYSTPEAVAAAVQQAKRMGPYCAGVLFFRWPAWAESQTTQPDLVLAAAGVVKPGPPPTTTVKAVDGACAAVHCADLYLAAANPIRPTAAHYVVTSSIDFEYFLPNEKLPVRLKGPGQLEVRLPPFAGRSRLHLGRAVTQAKAAFTLEERP